MSRNCPGRTVWQVSAGPPGRGYGDLLVRHGVLLLGPGDPGPWREGRSDRDFDGPWVRRLATEVAPGDPIVLRAGATAISAVGVVASEYLYLPELDDVNGLDLQHGRRVRWFALPDRHDFGRRLFGANPPRLAQVRQREVLDLVERFLASPPRDWQSAPLPALPPEEPLLDEPPPGVADLAAQAQDLARLYEDPTAFGELPVEDELVAHYVVPLLRALGWPAERIGVQWRRVDVAVFAALPRRPETCRFIVEAKRLNVGVEHALRQARTYLDGLGISRHVVLTDGVRYRLYSADHDFAPVAYANLARLKRPATALFNLLRRP